MWVVCFTSQPLYPHNNNPRFLSIGSWAGFGAGLEVLEKISLGPSGKWNHDSSVVETVLFQFLRWRSSFEIWWPKWQWGKIALKVYAFCH
jgi:hypothetical protein